MEFQGAGSNSPRVVYTLPGDVMHRCEPLSQGLAERTEDVFTLQKALTACRSLGPENGGQGEMEKASHISSWLESCCVDECLRIDAPDARVESGLRPNLVARLQGHSRRTLWLFAHMDVVPPGDTDAWHSDPWEVSRSGDTIYGRGVEDNQQALVGMLLLARELRIHTLVPELSLGLVFMADEETGSKYGLQHVLAKAPLLFHEQDLYIVPDGGSPAGDCIEVAEKAQLWLKVQVTGIQCHASTPQKGRNAFLAASAMALACHTELHAAFPACDDIFEPPYSTFVPSKHEANVPNINTVPGSDIFYLDCRLLPLISVRSVLVTMQELAKNVEKCYDVRISVDVVQQQRASQSSISSPVVKTLSDAVAHVYKSTARPIGIGGATVAAFLRERGLHVAVWSCIENTCHAPNEHSSIKATLKDAQVFAHILMHAHV